MPIKSTKDVLHFATQPFTGGDPNRISLGVHVFLLALIGHLLWKWYIRRRDNPEGCPFPPGPKPWPVIGNMFDFARENESAAYLGMAHKYGEWIFPTKSFSRLFLLNVVHL
jgi:hypothetical protein